MTQDRPDFHPYGAGSWHDADDSDAAQPPHRRRGRWTTAAVVVSGLVGGLVGAALLVGVLLGSDVLRDAIRPQITIEADGQVSPIAAVAEKVLPSVVNVGIQQAFVNPNSGGSAFRDVGNGSGVIIREDGYIITNNHVVEGADRIVVTVGVQEVEAEIVGADPTSDLAVLRVPLDGLPAAEFGSSRDLRVGQTVAAVGSPFGLDQSVSAGIVSALSRSSLTFDQSGVTAYTNLIQTDAAINPGNSGGALVDEQGMVIGINTLIESPSGAVGAPQSAGIGFAIPSDYVVEAAEQLIANGCIVHPYLGVSTATLGESTILQFDLPVDGGALVQFVTPDSPADAAGFEVGDIIVRLGGRPVASYSDVFTSIRSNPVGEVVEIEIVRGEDEMTLEATLGADTACERER